MKTSTLSRALVLGAASVPALTAVSCDKMPERKPNVIFILMDDAGYGDFGCYGQTRSKIEVIVDEIEFMSQR